MLSESAWPKMRSSVPCASIDTTPLKKTVALTRSSTSSENLDVMSVVRPPAAMSTAVAALQNSPMPGTTCKSTPSDASNLVIRSGNSSVLQAAWDKGTQCH